MRYHGYSTASQHTIRHTASSFYGGVNGRFPMGIARRGQEWRIESSCLPGIAMGVEGENARHGEEGEADNEAIRYGAIELL
ncbi:hypothetical protein AMJ39_01330 [candidate division TA06 bacterium DG_24]|jgi:hypothetical protein|uniref:Uncharacterized protein n=2 Tax=Bacteria division TA06 TaxID=1156500 RepID=A0A0S8JRL6_UNCT6|nr:MAG: hypothetical protein AMJ39_01330 [candidate division TA06 bacterium DG_24]KPL11484.1 MAG: hypothetical protein AMJ71_00800 [candidate division TA06 bacterium SM1_40]